jgi:hypothetical protein
MNTTSLYPLKTQLQREGVMLCFNGPINQSMVESIGDFIRNHFKLENADNQVSMQVFSVFIEQIQNMSFYSEEVTQLAELGGQPIRNGILMIGVEEEGHFLHCGNLIRREKQEKLASYMAMLQKMDDHELKQFYREKRRAKKRQEDSKGGGLGFIEMARKAKKFHYEIEEVDDDHAFFSLKVII